MNRFVLDDQDIIILGEKENQDVESNSSNNSIRGVANDSNDENTAKNLNGGPGSGDWGHAGRPGKVGGSSKSAVVNPAKRFAYGDIVKLKTLEGQTVQGELIMTAGVRGQKMATVKDADGNIHTGLFKQGYIEKIQSVDAPDTKPAERRTPKQKEALEKVFNGFKVDDKMQTYLLRNCSEDTATALATEMEKAQEEGIDFSNVSIVKLNSQRNRAQVRTEIYCNYEGEKPVYKPSVSLMLSSGLVAAGKKYEERLKKEYDKGEVLTKTIADVIRHEIGHIRANNLVSRLTNGNYNTRDYDRLNRLVTDIALKKTVLSFGDAMNYMSNYGLSDRAEMLAESFANPNYSKLTKAIVNEVNNFNDKLWVGRNSAETSVRVFDLCSGIPILDLETLVSDGD